MKTKLNLALFALLTCACAHADQMLPDKLLYRQRAIGEMSNDQRDAYLNLVNTNQLEQTPALSARSSGSKAPWQHTDHQFGFLGFKSGNTNALPIEAAHSVKPDTNLTRIDIRLDRLRVFDYPGNGRHFVLFTFAAQNCPTGLVASAENVSFSQTYEAVETEGAGVVGYPIFRGLTVGKGGVSFKCATVNVKNQNDERALGFLKSDEATQGLSLLTTAEPVVAPFTALVKGLGEMLLTRNENVKVQDFYMGLDFDDGASFGTRLREGNYVVVQAPDEEFSWSDWEYLPADGRILKRSSHETIPYNYIIFRVSKHID